MLKPIECFEKLRQGILEFDEDATKEAAEEVVKTGEDPVKAVNIMASTLNELGDKYQAGEVYLPELVMASDAFKLAMSVLEPEIVKKGGAQEVRPKVVIGTVKGDIHQIGKDIVSMFLMTAGFEVVDLGVEVDPTTFIDEAIKIGADIIACSALMSTTLPSQRDVIDFLKAKGFRDNFKIMVGGGVVTSKWADEIGADGYGQDAYEAVEVAKGLCKRRSD